MTELAAPLFLLGTFLAFVAGFFYAPAWQAGIVLALLAIYFRIDRDTVAINKNITSLASNMQGMYEQWKKGK